MTDSHRTSPLTAMLLALGLTTGGTGANAEAGSDFELVQTYVHRHSNPSLEVSLPYRFELHRGEREGDVFEAWGTTRYPSVALTVLPSDSSQACLPRMIERFGTSALIVSQTEESLQGRPATVGFVRWTAPIGAGIELQTMILCTEHEQQVVAVSATDGAPDTGFDERLAHAVRSLRFNPTSASKPSR